MTFSTGDIRLGVNIDHVATIRNARGVAHPDPIRAARLAEDAGADGITAHLREDRRHICDDDIARLKSSIALPLNLEMAATPEMRDIALRHLPHACCIVPERRAELTTEGGLDVDGQREALRPFIGPLADAGIRVSLFIDPDPRQIEAAAAALPEAKPFSLADDMDDAAFAELIQSRWLHERIFDWYLWSVG